ncbi:hypothetical protein PFAG_03201 [Plasmodium falciparum Santa Lucia]|uniref:Uncharacterized protein n=9 Tax=Plasmodium falciparum TaxID=5833 RepID=Q8IIP8_PLAF7|nr:conserved Plasmodium protein, unknown function [Plasmodium falciparum 3D7]ETW15583.1 hypothetical protein PFFVO_05876 [Plasmodium falciparum Vietnam Oak-Knoll (FVO)]ETW36019.1 hypothetical protein PFTANZ_03244 [Plasmodium falciparum Tanzania (2000708)]ETW42354.1 hypothetical protein PFNF135_03364 [Plasmodium falciparum NF135/5.C10]ETW60940.1 hypothetical protein PFMC_03171 [Plasmodium falciparum CAMP/Malaysia]EUR70048.1 hypothetical protein PFBG_03278 [Plasmodium falciparum 7G8]EUT84109.1 |eukprot:XP_001347793.1 conserved Plasmodium protein, unknown function [Plasmodium falciparum 3D7]
MKKASKNSNYHGLEKSLRRRGGKIKTIYEKYKDIDFQNIIDEKIKYVWNYINNIDDIISDEEFLKEEIKQKLEKKQSLKKNDDFDEIIYYNKNVKNLINIQKVRKALYHFNIKVDMEDIMHMFLYYTNQDYFLKFIQNNIYSKNYVERKMDKYKFTSININNLYINYEMFKFIFLNIDMNIEQNGQMW